MTSPTAKHKTRKIAKLAKMGNKRKNLVRIKGTTAKSLPLDKPNANEQALAKKSPKAKKA